MNQEVTVYNNFIKINNKRFIFYYQVSIAALGFYGQIQISSVDSLWVRMGLKHSG